MPTKSPEVRNRINRRWRENHPEENSRRCKEWRAKMKADPERWAAHQAERKAYHAARYKVRREVIKAQNAADYLLNRETILARNEAWRQKNKARHLELSRTNRRLRLYGVTKEEFASMVETQGGVCAICRKPEKEGRDLCLDHCHTTGKFRGALCSRCNRGLHFVDDTEWLVKAQEYVRKAHTKEPQDVVGGAFDLTTT